MDGLQDKLISRSKAIVGSVEVYLKSSDIDFSKNVLQKLQDDKLDSYREYEIELLVRSGPRLSPIIVHGVEQGNDKFSNYDLSGLVVGSDLASLLRLGYETKVYLISPNHIDPILGDIPRQISATVTDLVATNVADIDLYHAWVRDSLVHNLVRKKAYNKIRVFDVTKSQVQKSLRPFSSKVILKSWEELNDSLVKALKLEARIMKYLFVAATCLVGLSIISALFILFEKLKKDLISFWILGASKKKIALSANVFIHLVTLIFSAAGILLGLAFLYFLDQYGGEIMPQVFVDRKIPVKISTYGVMFSFICPYLITVLVSHFVISNVQKDEDHYLEEIRTVG